METEACADQMKKGEIIFHDSMKKLDENGVFIEAKDVVELSPPSKVTTNGGASMEPITPASNRESGDFPFDFTSPMTTASWPPKALCLDSHRNGDPCSSNEHSPCTPKEGVFDPFAPGPDKFMMAPLRTKHLQESRSFVARQLSFNSSGKCDSEAQTISDEEMLLETVYSTLLEAIVSKQTEAVLAEISALDSTSDECKTPTSAPHLNGIAEDCPAAPIKPARKSRIIDQGLCRKLEF